MGRLAWLLLSIFLSNVYISYGKIIDKSMFEPISQSTTPAPCTQQYPFQFCASNAIYVLDFTSYVQSHDKQNQVDMMTQKIIPQTSWYPYSTNQYVTFLAMGAPDTMNSSLSNNLTQACTRVQTLQSLIGYSGQTQSIYNTLLNIKNNYNYYVTTAMNIILITASMDASDIQNSASFARYYMPHVDFTVVSLSYWTTIYFQQSNFPAYVILDVIYMTSLFSSSVYDCLLGQACGNSQYCSAYINTPSLPTSTYAWPTTSTTPWSLATTTPYWRSTTTSPYPWSTPTPSSSPSNSLQCQCQYDQVWNDVIFLFDNSVNTGNNVLQELLGYVQTSFSYFNIQANAYNQQATQIGIITYNNAANLYSALGAMGYSTFIGIQSLPSSQNTGTNIDGAIAMAQAQFNSSAHRANARKVIVILASSYTTGMYADPTSRAQLFGRDDGIIVVYEYSKSSSTPFVLREIASPGYYILNTNDPNGDLMPKAMCNANCRCPATYSSYMRDPVNGVPTQGCFLPVETLGNYQIASRKCQQLHQSNLAKADSSNKTAFLESLFPTKTNFLNGMTWNSNTQWWSWNDGTPVSGYQPWCSSSYHSLDCVYVSTSSANLCWQQTDCRNGYDYVCEGPPCDSVRYCS